MVQNSKFYCLAGCVHVIWLTHFKTLTIFPGAVTPQNSSKISQITLLGYILILRKFGLVLSSSFFQTGTYKQMEKHAQHDNHLENTEFLQNNKKVHLSQFLAAKLSNQIDVSYFFLVWKCLGFIHGKFYHHAKSLTLVKLTKSPRKLFKCWIHHCRHGCLWFLYFWHHLINR